LLQYSLKLKVMYNERAEFHRTPRPRYLAGDKDLKYKKKKTTPKQLRGIHMRLERKALKNAQYCKHNAKNQVRKAASVLDLYSSRVHEVPPKSAIEYSMEKLQSALEWQELAEMAELKANEHFEKQKIELHRGKEAER